MAQKNYQSFTERVALVTNAAHGVGRAVAMQLAFSGAYVVAHYQPQDESGQYVIEQLQAIGTLGRGVAGVLHDATGAQSVIKAVTDVYGRLDMLVQTLPEDFPPVVASKATDLAEITPEIWRGAWRESVDAAFFCFQAAQTWLAARPAPAVVNLLPDAQDLLSASAYAALAGLTQNLADVCAPRLRVNAVAPQGQPPADETARAVCYLLSNEARFINGQILKVKK